jgi:hypothetical protein
MGTLNEQGKRGYVTGLKIQFAASVVWWSEFLATDPEIPGSISGATTFSEK